MSATRTTPRYTVPRIWRRYGTMLRTTPAPNAAAATAPAPRTPTRRGRVTRPAPPASSSMSFAPSRPAVVRAASRPSTKVRSSAARSPRYAAAPPKTKREPTRYAIRRFPPVPRALSVFSYATMTTKFTTTMPTARRPTREARRERQGREPEGLVRGHLAPRDRAVRVVDRARVPVEVVVQGVPARREQGRGARGEEGRPRNRLA